VHAPTDHFNFLQISAANNQNAGASSIPTKVASVVSFSSPSSASSSSSEPAAPSSTTTQLSIAGVLYECYRPEFKWWEGVVLLRRVVIVVVGTLLTIDQVERQQVRIRRFDAIGITFAVGIAFSRYFTPKILLIDY
jgi:hypothetical protein